MMRSPSLAARSRRLVGSLVALALLNVSPAAFAKDSDAELAISERQMAQQIDRRIDELLEADGVTPAPRSTDAEFLRRVTLDLTGTIPSASEVRTFLDDTTPSKRAERIDELLQSAGYVQHHVQHWSSALLPEVSTADFNTRYVVPGFEAWLKDQLRENRPYDEFVRDILTTSLAGAERQFNIPDEFTPVGYYQTKDIKPENLAAATSRAFLGIRLECAQCHDHPFDTWKQEQFWSFAAFYSGIERDSRGNVIERLSLFLDGRARKKLKIPGTETVVGPAYLDGRKVASKVGLRSELADRVTSPENLQFARMAVNRVWGELFGRGIVEPIDDFSEANPASHPELLDELAQQFILNGYDLQYVYRAITLSEAYQRSSRMTDPSQAAPEYFARMNLKGLTAEQLMSSLWQAIGEPPPRQRNPFVITEVSGSLDGLFSNQPSSSLERETTILQALGMMNHGQIDNATHIKNSRTLAAVSEYPLMTDAQRIEALFLATLSRKPTERELSRFVPYVKRGGVRRDSKQALADVMWVLLNTTEFISNH